MKHDLAELVTRHRRALSIVALALIAGLLFWGRLLMQDVPRTAIAEPEGQLVHHQPFFFDLPGEGDVVEAAAARGREQRRGEQEGGAAGAESDVNEKLIWEAGKNWARQRKSSPQSVDEQQRRESEIREAAKQLSLEQVWLDGEPRARINASLVGLGQSVHGFVVQNIQPGKVVLQQDGIVVVLEK